MQWQDSGSRRFGLYHNWIPLGEDNRVRQNPPGLITPTFQKGDPIPPLFAIGTAMRRRSDFPFPTIPAGSWTRTADWVGVRAQAKDRPNIKAIAR